MPEILLPEEAIATNLVSEVENDILPEDIEYVEPVSVTYSSLELFEIRKIHRFPMTSEITSAVSRATQTSQTSAATVLSNALAANNLESAVAAVEEMRTEEYGEYFGENLTNKTATALFGKLYSKSKP